MAQRVKNLPARQETPVQSLGQEDPLEKEMAVHSGTLAWRIPWTEEPGGLQSVGSQSRTRLSDQHCRSTLLCPQVSNQGQSLNTLGSAFLNVMWPHEIANGKWLLYPMRVELEGGQGPGQRGLCSPRPNVLQLVRLRRGGWGHWSRVGVWRWGAWGSDSGRLPWGWGLWRKLLGKRCHLPAAFGGTLTGPSPRLRMWTAGAGGGGSWGRPSRSSLESSRSPARPGGQCPLPRRRRTSLW